MKCYCTTWVPMLRSRLAAAWECERKLRVKIEELEAERDSLMGFENAYALASDCAKLNDPGEPDCGWCQRCLRARNAKALELEVNQ